jgi:vacuolar-type H+-ATPase subunit F/Vma7
MTAPVYLGDEISAAGWRLTGVRVSVPEPGNETAALASALASAPEAAPLVLVSAALAARIDAAVLGAAAGALSPLVLVLPDPQGDVGPPGLAGRLRTQLGLEA